MHFAEFSVSHHWAMKRCCCSDTSLPLRLLALGSGEEGGMQGAATFAVVAAQLQQAVEDDAGAHGVPNKGHRPVAMRALHQYMRQQPPRLRAAESSC